MLFMCLKHVGWSSVWSPTPNSFSSGSFFLDRFCLAQFGLVSPFRFGWVVILDKKTIFNRKFVRRKRRQGKKGPVVGPRSPGARDHQMAKPARA